MRHFHTPSALADALASFGDKISPQAIYKWKSKGIPVDRAPLLEAASNGAVRCEDICPDVQWMRDTRGNLTCYRVPVPQVIAPSKVAPRKPTPEHRKAG